PAVAAARGFSGDEETRGGEPGFPNTLGGCGVPGKNRSESGFSAGGTGFSDGSPRPLSMGSIPPKGAHGGQSCVLRKRDVAGVIGNVGTTLGKLGVNIATFALGRKAIRGEEAAALVRLDGPVSATILEPIRAIPAITEAKLLHLS